jgi:hypothetical protein
MSVSKRMNYGREMANFHVIAGFFNMPQSCDRGQKALLPLVHRCKTLRRNFLLTCTG